MNFPKRREQRQEEALERQEIYAKLTREQKIEKLDRGGFTAAKQRARLVE